MVSDSGGVRTVLLGNLDELSAPGITPDVVASTQQHGIELFNATTALFLDDGGLAVANAGALEVLLLESDGSLARRVGRQGEGPGEFAEVTSLVKTPAGFLVYDARLGRINEFTEAGEVKRDTTPLLAFRDGIPKPRPTPWRFFRPGSGATR